MLSQGLSYVTFNASNVNSFQQTLNFYQALGFKSIGDRSQDNSQSDEVRVAWLKLKAEPPVSSNATIKLTLNPCALTQHKPCGDVDWSLEEFALAFTINDINVCFLIDKKKNQSNYFYSQH